MYIAIDIGGTHTRVITFTDLSLESEVSRVKFPTEDKFENQYEKLVKAITSSTQDKKILGISISQTGLISEDKSLLLDSDFCKDFVNKPMKDMLAKEFDTKVLLENDAVCAGLAELVFGNHTDPSRLAYITVSTGVNGMFIKKLQNNTYQLFSPEFGHIKIKGDGRICQCGKKDCIQSYISGDSLKQYYFQNAESIEDLRIWEKTVEFLAIAAVNFTVMFSPTELVFGGGMIENNQYMREKLQYEITSQLRKKYMPIISISEFSDKVGAYGALALFKLDPTSLVF